MATPSAPTLHRNRRGLQCAVKRALVLLRRYEGLPDDAFLAALAFASDRRGYGVAIVAPGEPVSGERVSPWRLAVDGRMMPIHDPAMSP